jgi:hypothetical protein
MREPKEWYAHCDCNDTYYIRQKNFENHVKKYHPEYIGVCES